MSQVETGFCDLENDVKVFHFQQYIDIVVSHEGLSPNVPLYRVTEGNEPCFFKTYFSWDATKAMVCSSL
jgi:hypothetical protein